MSTEEVELVEEDEEVEYTDAASPFVIETGDSVKVKQVLDDATAAAIAAAGFEANYNWENLKLVLMVLSCVFAMVAQFYPIPFPESRPLLAVCCAAYFIISSVLQVFVTFVDKDTIMFTKPNKTFAHALEIRTCFPRFQEYFSLLVQLKGKTDQVSSAKMYVGRYFTEKGEFDEGAFEADVQRHMRRFTEGKYGEVEYNHKTD
ncbi:microsomal signal peptidase 25 kDa subunit-domain-containing protein [Ochromonadaceae sp. CCMP2298]|nr:microsomal signal peptidase 25 kDa subunit-domain-containing protein [Ochromonadaceae sp. CCMP2298]|mmetsp:Transcript_22599/g.50261  ORF Transcript_22599/g.50261 Transcript_22599/m.50261 type:complete len:203 (+) Transcript_22599:123-731(+)